MASPTNKKLRDSTPAAELSSLHICRKYIPNVECDFTPQFLQKFVSDSVLNWEIQSSCCAPPLCPLPQALTLYWNPFLALKLQVETAFPHLVGVVLAKLFADTFIRMKSSDFNVSKLFIPNICCVFVNFLLCLLNPEASSLVNSLDCRLYKLVNPIVLNSWFFNGVVLAF